MTTVHTARCFRCGNTQHEPRAFKVECSECHRYWHHRCHIPSLSDDELIARIKASTENDVDNGLAGWTCGECLGVTGISLKKQSVKASEPSNAQRSAVQLSKHITSDSQSLLSRNSPAKTDPAVKMLKYKQSTALSSDYKGLERIPPKRSSNSSSSTPTTTSSKAHANHASPVEAVTKISRTLTSQRFREPRAGLAVEQARSEHISSSEDIVSRSQTKTTDGGAAKQKRTAPCSDQSRSENSGGMLHTNESLPPPPPPPPPPKMGKLQDSQILYSGSSVSTTEQTSKASPAATRSAVQAPPSLKEPYEIGPTEHKSVHKDVDIEEDEDEDDLYGPLPEVELVPRRYGPSAPYMEVDDTDINERPVDSVSVPRAPEQSSNTPHDRSNQQISWIYGKFSHIAGDPWDRLLQRKLNPVSHRPRVKVQAKKLDSNRTISVENLMNFSVDEWINVKRF